MFLWCPENFQNYQQNVSLQKAAGCESDTFFWGFIRICKASFLKASLEALSLNVTIGANLSRLYLPIRNICKVHNKGISKMPKMYSKLTIFTV